MRSAASAPAWPPDCIGGAIVGGAIAVPAIITGPAIMARATATMAGRPMSAATRDYSGGCYWQRQRFWDGYGWRYSPRAGLRLISFSFIKSNASRKPQRFRGAVHHWPEKTAFSAH